MQHATLSCEQPCCVMSRCCCAGFRDLHDADYPAVTSLLNDYLSQYKLHQNFDEQELRHFLKSQKGLIYAYVVEAEDGTITDLCSFYSLPSSILHNHEHTELRAAYMCGFQLASV